LRHKKIEHFTYQHDQPNLWMRLMDERIILLKEELKALADECRIHAKGRRPDFSLMRAANTIQSLLQSLDESSLSEKNPLTKREHEILSLVSKGFTNREIASALTISEKTIEFHIKSILAKTDASTRTEATTYALKNKWID